jgi:DNA-binding response OmpR family regulator
MDTNRDDPADANAAPEAALLDANRSKPARILLVEDEFFVAVMLEDDLRAAGFSTLGPFRTLASAREAACREQFNLAVLDINLNGEAVYPLADELLARGIPLLFLSGYVELPERFKAAPQLSKPHNPEALVKLIRRMVAAPG